jgi:hypothetical protein
MLEQSFLPSYAAAASFDSKQLLVMTAIPYFSSNNVSAAE